MISETDAISHQTAGWGTSIMLALLCIAFCSCSTPALKDISNKYGKPFPGKGELKVERQPNSSLNVDLAFQAQRDTASPQYNFVMSIIDATLIIMHPEKGMVDSVRLSITSRITGLTEKDSIFLLSIYNWTNENAYDYESLVCHVILNTTEGIYHLAQDIPLPRVDGKEPIEFITVSPFVDEQTDSSVTFALLAKRNRGQSLDYHPDGEKFRVEIFTMKDVMVFSSRTGMEFTQGIQPVEPRLKGEFKRYIYQWMGVDDKGKPLPPGRYKAVLTIVSKPKAAVGTVEFDWKGKGK